MRSATASSLPLLTPSFSIPTFTQQSQLCPFTIPAPTLSPQNPSLSHQLRRSIIPTKYRRRDPNAGDKYDEEEDGDDDEFGRQRRRWWSDYSPPEMDRGPESLEEFIDSIWIIKIFGSYYPLLPAFLLSMLLATGPKAFLMSLALLIGQSAFTFALKKLWDEKQNKPKRKTKSKKRARINTASNVEYEEEEIKWTQKGKTGYRSWVGRDDTSVDKDNQNPSTFGGWDDLDTTKEFDTKYRGRRAEKGRFSRRERKSEMPLLLRLLIAVFPFLSSWTKML